MGIINDTFMLKNATAKRLYEQYAKNLPIIDYHCHINPEEIAEDRKFDNITQVWLGGDHYKWRLIRSNGAPENEITGDADDRVKFQRFAEALPKAIGNPMYHWTHLELKKYFDCDDALTGKSAEAIWTLCNEKLAEDTMSVRGIIAASNVELIGTTDDPIDDLRYHKQIAADESFSVKVLPSFRPDKAVNIDKDGFIEYIGKLSEVCEMPIKTVADVKTALSARLAYFAQNGCKISDHGLDSVVFAPASDKQIEKIFAKAMKGKTVSAAEAETYKTAILLHLGREYAAHGIVMQLHYGAQRNTNQKMFKKLGPDTGFDCISTAPCGEKITALLNALEETGELPKTILYSLNPQDNALLDTILGCFQSSDAVGKIQHGSAWWFSDTARGMEEQMKSLADLSILGNFVGMLTDSRSFLSYTRHDYFRRILCNVIGTWVEEGEYPNDEDSLKEIIEGICYYNAKKYFGV